MTAPLRGVLDCAAGIRAAIAFLTRIPMGNRPLGAAARAWAPAHFPLVGAILGALALGVWCATPRLGVDVRAWLVVAALIVLTGAFHEDGLADTSDALGGAFTRAKLFEILKDSRIGTFGTVALVCALVLRAKLLATLLPLGPLILIASQTVSRCVPVLMLRLLPYVTDPNVSRSSDYAKVSIRATLLSVGWTAAVLLGLSWHVKASPACWLTAISALVVASLWLAWRFHRRAGGVTGDFLGAAQQIGELAFLLGFSWSLE